jgi:hypothetical protein
MQRKRIAGSDMLWQGRISGDEFGCGDQMERGGRQHREVQRLANVAGGFRTAGVLVEKAAAGGKVQQHGARQ